MQDLLKYVDVLVGLSLVMLLASTVIAAVTQIFTSGTFARARYLRRGIARLIAQLHPDLAAVAKTGGTATMADVLADAALRHPMIGHEGIAISRVFSDKIMGVINEGTKKLLPGAVIEREELIRVLLEIAANEGPLSGDMVADEVRKALIETLKKNGVADPAATLRLIREKRIQLELDQPQLSQAVWHAQAVMSAGACDFVGKVNSWFDNTMDRVTQRFALQARMVTTVIALVFVIVIQLDVRDLVTRLWADDALRKDMIEQATAYQTRVDTRRSQAQSATTTDEKAEAKSQADEDQERWNAVQQSLVDMRTPGLQLIPEHLVWEGVAQAKVEPARVALAKPPLRLVVDGLNYPVRLAGSTVGSVTPAQLEAALALVPAPVRLAREKDSSLRVIARDQKTNSIRLEAESAPGTWMPVSVDAGRGFDLPAIGAHFWGVLFAWILVSLGAPFWYDALKNLLKFRSLVAQKEDRNREERNTTQAPPAPPGKAAGASA